MERGVLLPVTVVLLLLICVPITDVVCGPGTEAQQWAPRLDDPSRSPAGRQPLGGGKDCAWGGRG